MSNHQRALEISLLAAVKRSRQDGEKIAKALNGYKFTQQTLTWIWEGMRAIQAKGEPVRLVSMRAMVRTEAVTAHGPLDEALLGVWQATPSESPLIDAATLSKMSRADKLAKGMDRAVKAHLAGDLDGTSQILENLAQDTRETSNLAFSPLIDFDEWDKPLEHSAGILTGIRTYDEVTSGGVNRGDLGVIFGNTNMGKSLLVVNIGYAAMKYGKRVLHIDSENGIELVKWRYIARILRKPTNTLLRRQGRGVEGFREWAERHQQRFHDSIRFCNIGVDQTPLEELDARIFSEIADGWPPDVIIFDTPDQCVLKQQLDNAGMIAKIQYTKCKSIVQRANAAGWTVTQAKAESEGKIATNKNVAWGYDKARLATTVLTINPGLDEHGNPLGERSMGARRSLFVAKARNAQARFVLPLRTDFATAYIAEDITE